MKVADVMQTQVDFVTPDFSLMEVAKLIFGRGINGVPVCKGKKLVGMITEKDILQQFFPSMQEVVEDFSQARDFEGMEDKVSEMLSLSASKIMSHNPTTVTPDTPLLKAQSLMQVREVGRLPVVDKKGNLVGLLSKGDIFKSLVGQKLPFEEDEQFHDWLSRRYDVIINWEIRLAKEIPDIVRLFKKEKVKNILDLGCGTGMHAIELARRGFNVAGLDRSSRMIYTAKENLGKLSKTLMKRLKFIHHEYQDLDQVFDNKFDAVMSMGAGLAHISNPQQAIKEINKVLNNRAIFLAQIPNFAKIFKLKNRLYDFNVRKSSTASERGQAFLRFYDPEENGYLTQNVCVFVRRINRWEFRGMNAVSIYPLTREKTTSMLQKIGFSKFSSYGGERGFFYDYLLRRLFNPKESDVLVVVAKR